ncbi:MAG: hypothetical protein JTT11_03405 [Candidatus Brockarchaeota archaeon]|nr:hypothetical protein [Candidatus Brockarchaeota archaeon]
MQEVSLDVSIARCPNCGKLYVDASWYVAEIGSDVECGACGREFNSKKNIEDRVLVRFNVDESGKVGSVELSERLPLR